MKEQRRLLLGAGDGNSKLLLTDLSKDPATGERRTDGLFDAGLVQGVGLNPVKTPRSLPLRQQLHGAGAIPANGSKKVEGAPGVRREAGLEPGANVLAVGQEVVEEMGDGVAAMWRVAGGERE